MSLKRTGIPVFLLFIFFIFSCSGNPKIQFDELKFDFGRVKQDTVQEHIFSFRNTGNSVLKIKEVKATCGCTGVLLSEDTIPAGGDGKLDVKLKIGKSMGKIRKSIYVFTNDKDNEKIKLELEAQI